MFLVKTACGIRVNRTVYHTVQQSKVGEGNACGVGVCVCVCVGECIGVYKYGISTVTNEKLKLFK